MFHKFTAAISAVLLSVVMCVPVLGFSAGGTVRYEGIDVSEWQGEIDWQRVKDAGIEMASSEVTMIPQNYVELTDETAVKNLQRTLDLLDEDDDVQAVYHNWDE